MKRTPRLPQWPPRLRGVLGLLRWHLVPKMLLAFGTAGALTALIYLNLDYYRVGSSLAQLRAGQPAPRDIIARRTIAWEDADETKRRRDEAAARVPVEFTFDPGARPKARTDLDRIFSLLRIPTPSSADRDALAQTKLLPEAVLSARGFAPAALDRMQQVGDEALMDVMRTRIEEGEGEEQAGARVDEMLPGRGLPSEQAAIAAAIVKAALRPTWVKDEARTRIAREAAREKVSPVVLTIRPGDVLLRKGEILTKEELDQLKEKQLLEPAPLTRVTPFAALMLLGVLGLGAYLRHFARPVYASNRKLVLLSCLILAAIWATGTLGAEHEFLIGLMAVPAGCMAIAGLLGVPVALPSAVLISLATALTADSQFAMVLLTVGSALAGIMVVSSIWPASRAVPAVLALIVINLALLLCIEAIQPGGGLQTRLADLRFGSGFPPLWPYLGRMALWATMGAVGATFIAVGSIYMLARPFGITTYYRLLELANPNQSLLRRMMVEAPGSYHSSVMVANIAEAAANAIGADPLLTRIGALYHDIGKLKRPAFFIENQASLGVENVHQRLSPKMSYLILASHIRDGVEIARQHKLPEEVIAIVREHHGSTLTAYFYHRAVNEANGEPVSELDFRYPGPKPSSREAAAVMLADSVQASVKSIKEPTPARIESMVTDIIDSRLADGQLEDCDITLRDLRNIRDICVRILSGLYTYSRLDYPDIKRGRSHIHADLVQDAAPAADEAKTAAPSR